jgi:hypothetical protein
MMTGTVWSFFHHAVWNQAIKKRERIFLNSDQVQQIYLDEFGDPNQQPIGINLMQLTIARSAAP